MAEMNVFVTRNLVNTMDTRLNTTNDGAGNNYDLHFEIKDSSIPEYVDIQFYSKLSNAKNPDTIQVNWQTTLPLESIDELSDTLIDYLRTKVTEKL